MVTLLEMLRTLAVVGRAHKAQLDPDDQHPPRLKVEELPWLLRRPIRELALGPGTGELSLPWLPIR